MELDCDGGGGSLLAAVPKDLEGNLAFRKSICKAAARDRALQQQLWNACARYPLFWINTFVWTFDVLDRFREADIPFITWPFQDKGFEEIFAYLGREDIFCDKSREMGASWMFLTAFDHQFIFRRNRKFLLVSRNETLVDGTGDSDTLMWKLDYIHEKLPHWMRPQCLPGSTMRRALHMGNPYNGSTIDGCSTTGNISRGGRRHAILLDEFGAFPQEQGFAAIAATAAATRCRCFNSTPQGIGNAHHAMSEKVRRKLRFHWSEHPFKRAGLYTSKDGDLEIIDTFYDFPPNYPFILDGKIRSPWYDEEVRERYTSEMMAAQELDINYLGSGGPFFPTPVIEKHIKDHAKSPFRKGTLLYNDRNGEPDGWGENPTKGKFLLWMHLDANGNPPADRDYVLGADISAGTGASNSCLCVADRKTGEIILEYADPNILPHEFATLAVAVARWFKGDSDNGAHMIWEANAGPGRTFGQTVIELDYRNIYYDRDEDKISSRTQNMKPGWWSGAKAKQTLLDTYLHCLMDGTVINRSELALKECFEYRYDPATKKPIHVKSESSEDPSGARDNHGDRVIMNALVASILRKQKRGPSAEPIIIPKSCVYTRLMKYRREQNDMAYALADW